MANICVIILNWNGWADTVACLESILPDVPRGIGSVVVVDNASYDDSVTHIDKWLRFTAAVRGLSYLSVDEVESRQNHCAEHNLVLIRSHKNRGYAAGNNLGLEYALKHHRGNLVWILNNDVVIHESAIEELLKYVETIPEKAIIGSTIVEYDDRKRVQCAGGAAYNVWLTTYRAAFCGKSLSSVLCGKKEPRLDYISGAAMLIPMDVLRDVGVFNPDYFLYYEEIDYARRAATRNCGLGWCRRSIVFHRGGATAGSRIGGNIRKSTMAEYHSDLSALKYTRRFHPAILPFAFVNRLCLKIIHVVAKRDFYLLRPLFEAYGDFLLNRAAR